MVVGENSPYRSDSASQVLACTTKVFRGGGGGVEDVEGIGNAVAVPICCIVDPSARNKLHRANGPVKYRIAIESSMIRVQDQCRAIAVQRNADDPVGGQSAGEKPLTPEAPMIGFDTADCRQQSP